MTVEMPDRWRAGGTELDITGIDASESWLAAVAERASEGHIVALTVNGVPVAWVCPPRLKSPAIMRQMQAERMVGEDFRRSADETIERSDGLMRRLADEQH